MWVPTLGQGDPQEEEMATHSSVLAWRIPGAGEPGALPSLGSRMEKAMAPHSSTLAWKI